MNNNEMYQNLMKNDNKIALIIDMISHFVQSYKDGNEMCDYCVCQHHCLRKYGQELPTVEQCQNELQTFFEEDIE